ncbi:hypothetical protein HL653_12460 [Sphingomonas sp. AP4-R1]|uniref:S41 family peptidase n=1 Tax=Sphingomonas sp. AP4-R1 TaxID=2735134 RepID=UPI00149391CE|nr:S41 family peptidase [Sphingomonas sp. AP4-R1]QJU58469.1 hypothetical protein HL653_12460 [Sphingomonas sp. AP4-R1]
MFNGAALTALLLVATASMTAPLKGQDWASKARQDIASAHDIIRDNHPGPVDVSNPRFKDWLERGQLQALAQAKAATTESDYWRALTFYINGFQDGHLTVRRNGSVAQVWPGFLTSTDALGVTRITVSTIAAAPIGARVAECDGVPSTRLLDERVHPYLTNAGIAHERLLTASYLFVGEAGDRPKLMKACRIETGVGAPRRILLDWKPIDKADLAQRLPEAQGRVEPPLAVRQINGVWFVSLPSFNWWGDQAAKMQAMVEEVKRQAGTLHSASRVVIDVRGNPGGNSQWASEIASALWSDNAVLAITNSFDQTVDWRASAQNAQLTRASAARSMAAGLTEDARGRNRVADQMDAARAKGQDLFTDAELPTSRGLPSGYTSPFKGKVFFLTDMRCASACLDFADVVTRMPGVTHIGQPTSADTVYIDNVEIPLPSGNARLSYSLKVYRHRLRGSNQWYSPKVVWPGGQMTDASVARWVATL